MYAAKSADNDVVLRCRSLARWVSPQLVRVVLVGSKGVGLGTRKSLAAYIAGLGLGL